MKAVARLLALLEYMAPSQDGISITDATADLRIPASGVHRLLRSLEEAGYVSKDTHAHYHLTLKIASVAAKVLDTLDIRKVASPFLEHLSAEAEETVHLGVLEDGEVVYVEKITGPRRLRMASRIGERFSAHSTALGKVLLAALPEQEVWRIIGQKGLPQRTPNTIVGSIHFLNHLSEVRDKGYALDNEENEPGVRCVAAPILDHRGQTIAAVSVSGSIASVDETSIEKLVKLVVETGRHISFALGYDKGS